MLIMSSPKSLFDKIWDQHVIEDLGGGYQMIHIDRSFIHDLVGPISLRDLKQRNLPIANPELTYAIPDHLVSSMPGKMEHGLAGHPDYIPVLRTESPTQGFHFFDIGDDRQGIIHVVGPEQGITLPGLTIACGDSHTSTHGGIGALAWGIGASDTTTLLATQCIIERKPKSMRITIDGQLPSGTGAKDLVLKLISDYGSQLGIGYVVEFAGKVIRDMSIEARLTVCNLAVEMGTKRALIAPDDLTFEYLRGRPYAPTGKEFEHAVAHWRTLNSDEGASFDHEITIDASDHNQQISWGINPSQSISIHDSIPSPEQAPNKAVADSWRQALDYMGLQAGKPIIGTPIDQVFIGSCTNGRLSDLEAAAVVVKGHHVAPNIVAWVVPGSQMVKKQAEQRGLDKIFIDAGFEWRESSCSLCSAINGDLVPPYSRCVSTSNRNYMGRQGPLSRTHLANPRLAAAAAIAGKITDVESLSSFTTDNKSEARVN